MFRFASAASFGKLNQPRSSPISIIRFSKFTSPVTYPLLRMASTLPRIPIFEAISAHDPCSTAVIHSKSGRRFSYGQLLKDVAKEKENLLELLGPNNCYGQRIAFMVENSYDYVVTLLSILGAHSIALPLSSNFPVSEIQYILSQSQSTIFLASSKFKSKAQKVIDSYEDKKLRFVQIEKKMEGSLNGKIVLEDPLHTKGGMILYTSGTTNRPKGVLLPQSVMTAQSKCLITAWRQSSKDHLLHILPLCHIHGIVNGILAPLFAGSKIEFLFPFNPSAVWERMAAPYVPNARTQEKISYITAVPTIYNRLLTTYPELSAELQKAAKTGISLANLRLNISGSASLPASIKKSWTELSGGNVLLERYGMTEVGMALSCGLAMEDRVDGSVGWPLPGVEVRLVETETNKVILHGEEIDKDGKERDGEIQLRGPTIFKEYFNNELATRMEHVESEDGCGRWFKTGDIASRKMVDTAGLGNQEWARGPMYFIRGRKSTDIIKSGGEKVSALEVEGELLLLPQVSEAAVLAVSSGAWGQKIAAVVVLKPESERGFGEWTVTVMRRALRDRLARHKIPRLLKIVDHIPRNTMGKINKKELATAFFKDDISGDEAQK
ncbi:Acyl-CoA synthetase family member 3, mitochondrial [Golovinomyces cichoracearum]|uniref:Acyl-CoA synthetase family member 3, mitochondrial n=1 Tax=Golovinomyces cichoracearum TaxID=62708 RepID=A0A420H8S6_9PEZI|nr:Acyl-CoA synthetase family member 3, mitochondrial [Golovinomyces cichoracearum]